MKEERKILRQQMEILAECSKHAIDECPEASIAMKEIYESLTKPFLVVFSVVTADLFVCFVVLIKNLTRRKA